ncbi:MAG: leucine-rich repeat protein, partial [Candidatus Methanomethylophilus sp.]|nr:leucine-rich repeat protein [Methanomethylophilus sp.]
MNIKTALSVMGIIVGICIFWVTYSDSSDAQNDDVFSQPDLGYMNGYYFTLDSPEETANIIEKGGLSYWIKTDSQGNLVAQLVSVGEIREDGQVIIVPKTIDVDNKSCQVVSVGPYFQPFNIFDYSTNQYIRHVGLTDNLKTQDPPILPGPLGYRYLTEPQYHYSIVFQGPVKIQDYAFNEFDLFNAPILKAYCYYTKSGLTSVTFEEGATSIGQWAFAYSSVEEIIVPQSVVSVGDYAFYASCIQDVIWNSDADITAHVFQNSSLSSITIAGEPKIIGERAFNGTNLTSLSIPDSVLEIGSHAFFQCKSLTTVSIGQGVEAIPRACFNGCEKLEEVIVRGTIKEVGDTAFSLGPSLTSFDFTGVEKIGYDAFKGAFRGGKDIVLDLSKVKRIENNAFSSCNANITLVLSPDLEYVGEYALAITGSVTNSDIQIPSGCVLEKGAFYGMGLTSVSFGNECIVKSCAFNYCTVLESITFGDNCTLCDANGVNGPEGTFRNTRLTSITIPSDLVLDGAVFFDCTSLEIVIFEDGRASIEQNCFRGCTNLAEIKLPGGLKTIGAYAFAGCTKLDLSNDALNYTAEEVLSWSYLAFVGT